MSKTSAIVIWTIKYGDSSLIANCYTKNDGLIGYMLNGILKSKKRTLKKALFQPFNIINIISNRTKKEGLNYIKEASVIQPLSLHNSVIKTSIILFLSEILKNVLKEEKSKNSNLYDYLETMILWMDSNHPNPNFHIKFLIELTRFIGFYPNISNKNKKYFDLSSGCFTDKNNSENILSISNMRYFKEILGMDFDQIKTLNWNHNIRIDILNEIIRYYTIHLQNFKTPKSLSVLHEIFK